MKKGILLIALMSTISLAGFAQEKHLNLYGGYVFDESLSQSYDYNNYFRGNIAGGFQYGAGLEIKPHAEMGVELLWMGSSTDGSVYYRETGYLSERNVSFHLVQNYALLAFNGYGASESRKVEGYGGFMLGALFADAENTATGISASATRFAWGLRMGANIWTSHRVGVKLQAQLLSAVNSVGGTFYFGTGGYGTAVSTYSSMLQFSLGGGLVFNLSK